MSLRGVALGLVVPGCFVLASLAFAEKPNKANGAVDDKEVVTSKAVKRKSAASINFRKALGLPFPTLNTLGPRIASARRTGDPVALAHAASELAVAEKVSGKKASLMSTELLQEAAELAKLKRQVAQLQAVRAVSDQVANTEDIAAGLQTSIAENQQRTQAEQDAFNRSQEPTWKPRRLIVNNHTSQNLDIFVNGDLKMQIAPGMRQVYMIEHRWNPTVLTAYGDDDSITFGPRYIWGRFDKYTWNVD